MCWTAKKKRKRILTWGGPRPLGRVLLPRKLLLLLLLLFRTQPWFWFWLLPCRYWLLKRWFCNDTWKSLATVPMCCPWFIKGNYPVVLLMVFQSARIAPLRLLILRTISVVLISSSAIFLIHLHTHVSSWTFAWVKTYWRRWTRTSN